MEKREHDLFLDMASNPGATFDNLVVAGVNANNTALQDKSAYEQDEWVREQFKNEYGEFDQASFDAFYNNVKIRYNFLANANYDESMNRQATYHRDNIFAPIEQREKGPKFREIHMLNPYRTTSSIQRLGREGSRTQSIDELAQTSKVLLNPTTAGENLENAQWGDAPNDNFWEYFTDTLVMAQYDSDGTHPDPFTGQQVEHRAGDPKTDSNGNFYYEKLDGRDVYGKRVLNKMNVLTTDGSFWNQYDFFDSDDLNQKSIGGTIMKNLALVGTMFIPYVGPWIAGASVASQLVGLLGTLGKMATGSDSPIFSAMEGWSKSVNRQGATSEYAQEHTWCWENFINLIGDVAGQLREQRFIFEKIPYIFKGTNIMTKEEQAAKLEKLIQKQRDLNNITIEQLKRTGASTEELLKAQTTLNNINVLNNIANRELETFVKGYNTIGEVLSKGYMTAITVGDTYGEAKQAGASDIDATLLTLGYAAGEYAILSTGLGEWILPELRAGRYKSQAIARALTRLDNETKQSALQTARDEFARLSTKEGKKAYVKNLFNIGKNLARDVYTAEKAVGARTLPATFASALGEGVEEVSEELLADFSKGCYDVVKWLQGEDTRINTFGYDFEKGQWNSSEILDRYGISLVGGFVGGGLTNLATNYSAIKSYNNMTNQQAIQELVYMARNGGLDDFMKQVNKMQLGKVNASINYEVINGTPVYAPGTPENNQDTIVKRIIQKQINIIQSVLAANGAVSDNRFLDTQTLSDLRFAALHQSTTAGLYLQTYNSLLADIVTLTNDLNNRVSPSIDTNNNGAESDTEKRNNTLSDSDKKVIENLNNDLKEKKKQLQDLVEGKSALDFVATALFETTSALSGEFTTPTFPLYAENMYHKKLSELTEDEKQRALKYYQNWKATEGREQLHTLAQIYRYVAEQSSQVIKNHEKTYMQTSQELANLNNIISRFYTITTVDGHKVYLPRIFEDQDYLDAAQSASNAALSGTGKTFSTAIQQIRANQDLIPELAVASNTIVSLLANEEQKTNIKLLQVEMSQIGDDTPSEEIQKLVNNYVDQLEDILINNTIQFVTPYLERGFANSETKNQLTQLLQLAHNRAIIKQSNWDQMLDNGEIEVGLRDQPVNPYNEISRQLRLTLQAVDKLNATPLEQNLNEFAISLGKEPINLTQLIERLNASFNDISDSVTKFNMDEALYDDLKNAIWVLKMYRASIRGARTDGASLSNIFGYNATLNEVADKIEGVKKPQLAEIDKTVADVFDQDISTNLNKLEFLKRLYEVNQGQKLSKQDRVSVKKDLLVYKRLRYIVDIRDDDPLKDWEGFLNLKAAIDGMSLHKQLLDNKNLVLTDEQKITLEKEKLTAENAIYDFFQIESNKQKLKDPKKLAEFINPSRLQLYTEASELLDEGLENLDDSSIVWWIASRAALRSQDFYFQYKQIINPEAKNPLAPIATQELAIYNNYASIVNGEIFTNFHDAYRYAIASDWQNVQTVETRKEILKRLGKSEILADNTVAKYALSIISVPKYSNIVLTEGVPGAGKSVGVFQPTLKLLKTFHKEVLTNVAVVHGANSDSAIVLRDNIGLTKDNSKTYGREQLMKLINSNWKEYPRKEGSDSYQIPDSDYTITNENEIRSSLGVNDTSTPPSLIIIDEISKFSAYDVDQINKFAQKYGITVLVAGDFDQTGVVGSHDLNKAPELNALVSASVGSDYIPTYSVELSRMNFIHSPKMGVSMRTDNSVKTINLQKMQAYMQNPNGQVDFNYYEDETGLYGDVVLGYAPNQGETSISAVPTVLEYVQKMKATLKEGQKIGLIYSSETSPIYTALHTDEYKDIIDFKKGGAAQGLEGQYYIIEANPTVSTKEYLRDIYTGMSRAQQGNVIIAPLDYDGVKFGSNSTNTKIDEGLKSETIVAFAKKRKQILDQAVTDGNVLDIIPRNTKVAKPTTQTPQPPQSAPSGLESGVPVATFEEKKAQLLQEMEVAQSINELNRVLQEVQNNNPELGNDPDVIEAHRRISDRLAPTPVPTPVPQPSTEVVITPLSHEDLVQKYGDKLNIDKFTITVDGITIPLTLDQMPFVTRDMDTQQLMSGTSSIINHYGRNLVVVNIGGFHQPFYMSTGHGGKATVAKGQWYPIFGISAEGQLNKGNEEQINSYYGSPILQSIAERLNELLGTGLQEEMMGPPTPAVFKEGFVNPVLDFINQDMHPVENDTETTVEQVNNNIREATEIISKKVEELKQNALPATSPQVYTLIYKDDIAPITQTDVINDTKYQQQIDEASRTKNTPESTAIPQGKAIPIDMLLHTFNTFELGTAFDENDMPISFGSQQWMDSRIDSINGLVKISQLLYNTKWTRQQYVKLIGDLRNIIFNTVDKSKIQEEIQKLLGLQGIYCTFALKSSPRIDRSQPEKLTDGYFGSATPFVKNINDKTLFNGSKDTRSNEWHQKSIVVIIGTQEHGNLLELPLLALSSPFSILQSKGSNGNYLYKPILDRYDEYIYEDVDLYYIAAKLISEFQNDPQYEELIDLFKLFTFTDAGVFYVEDPQWTPVRNLQLLGPQFITEKGYYQAAPGLAFNNVTNPETEWITLEEFSKNPQITMTQIMVSLSGTVDGMGGKAIVNAGHPFVLVSFNKKHKTDTQIIEQYVKQQQDPSTRKEVKLMYVLPPKATLDQYLTNLNKILTEESDIEYIGNLFTSYKLLKVLMQDERIRNILETKAPGVTQRITNELNALNSYVLSNGEPDNKTIAGILWKEQDWHGIGSFGKAPLAGLFDSVIAHIAYDERTLDSNYRLVPDAQGIDLIKSVLTNADINGVYYKVRITKNTIDNGVFVLPYGNNETIAGESAFKAFKIHGKLDSYTFKGQMGWLVKSALEKIKYNERGMGYSTDNKTYMRWDKYAGVGYPGNSNLSKRETETDKLAKNTIEYVKRKLGIDVTSIFNGKSVEQAQKQIVQQINSENNKMVAFTIGNQLLISNKSDYIDGPVYIYDANKQPITDISALADNNGRYNFTISTTLDGKQVQFNATYNGAELEIILPVEQAPQFTVSVTPETFNTYIDEARKLLESVFENDFLLYDVFNTTTYEEFLNALQNMIYVGEEFRIAPLKALLPTANPLQTQIINDIITVEKSHDPDKQDVTEENVSCPPIIKIKF